MPLSRYQAFALAYVVSLLVVQSVLVTWYAPGELINVASAAFQLVGVYAIIVGLMLRSRFGLVTEALTSAKPLEFVAGNSALLPLASSVILLVSKKNPMDRLKRRLIRALLSMLFLVVGSTVLLLHMLVIVPLAWVAYLFANVITDLVLTSGISIRHTVSGSLEVMRTESMLHEDEEPLVAKEESNTMTVREFFTENRGAAVSFLVSVPSIGFGVILKLLAVF